MTSLVALVVLGQEPRQPAVSQAVLSGIVVTELRVPEGMVQVYLPADMQAGDTISGTVVADAVGEGETRLINEKVLTGYVIEVAGQSAQRSDDKASCWIRVAQLPSAVLSEIRFKRGGTDIGTSIFIAERDTALRPSFVIPEVSATGRPVSIAGPFDGDAGTTRCEIGGKAAGVICETPRGAIVQPDASFVGKKTVTVSDGASNATGTIFLPRLTLSATKTNLLRGETATMTLRVDGLEGAPDSIYPIPIEIVNHTPQVIDLAQRINFGIERSDVRGDQFTRTFRVTATESGGFTVSGLLWSVSLHNAKAAMTRREFNDWLKAVKLGLTERIKLLESSADPGAREAVGRKRKALQALNAVSAAQDAGQLARAVALADKALADDSHHSNVADLIAIAIDMLGFELVPLSDIGVLIRGALAAAQGLPKTHSALQDALKVHQGTAGTTTQRESQAARDLKKAMQQGKLALESDK